jgi:UDP-3-O-[3-hydroxymyristoyl] N-acetylglucosamine deacetylase
MLDLQTTIERPSSCFGIGAHSGKKTQVTLKPAPANTGIVFIRSDIRNVTNVLQAHFSNISDTSLATTISNDAKVKVSTIEHLMAALYGCGIDNVLVEVDGEEIPIMDGSSKPFIFMIECAGTEILGAPRKKLQILKELFVEHKGSKIVAKPAIIPMINHN